MSVIAIYRAANPNFAHGFKYTVDLTCDNEENAFGEDLGEFSKLHTACEAALAAMKACGEIENLTSIDLCEKGEGVRAIDGKWSHLAERPYPRIAELYMTARYIEISNYEAGL